MIRLSVIIVNYNVKYFLEQVLLSVGKASEHLSVEVIVVDNHSADGSVAMVREKFPHVVLIENHENTGFSRANNQGIQRSKGEYVLLLNPDTVVEEDTFEKVIEFMDDHADAGGLGVKMLDGKGNFLPESKRSFPSPRVAFFKAFGLSALFPKTRLFGAYHLGYLGEDEVHEVDVLAGAFMLLRRSVLDEIGLLDEDFFMYGEDIDLSYRIVKAGYKNYYFPQTRIIHYKGESTKKGSLNYVRMFYSAMKIFARKHFSDSSARIYIALINLAISLRAGLAIFRRFISAISLPLADAVLIFAGMYGIMNFWEQNIKWLEGVKYPPEYLFINVPLYILIWLTAVWLSGGYDLNSKAGKFVRGILIGTLVIAAVYGFLEEGLRFSRGMILSGAVWAVFSGLGIRFLLAQLGFQRFRFGPPKECKVAIVGGPAESARVERLLSQFEVDADFMGFVNSGNAEFSEERLLGRLDQLADIVRLFDIDEIIFCAKDISSRAIIHWMMRIGPNTDYKIVPQEALSIIGSNSKNKAGDLYSIDIHLNITEPRRRRSKRLLDLLFAFAMLLTFPIQLFTVRNKAGLWRNIWSVLSGKKSWVGYCRPKTDDTVHNGLPKVKPGVLSPLDALLTHNLPPKTLSRLDLIYAKDYETAKDWSIIWRAWRNLGRSGKITP